MSENYDSKNISNIAESIMYELEFESQQEIQIFLDLLKCELINNLDKDYSTEDSVSSEEIKDKLVKEEFKVKVDNEGFYSLDHIYPKD